MKKALVAMSGGVDSSAAVWLMKEKGYDCMGVTMKLHEELGEEACRIGKTCCSLDDVEDARSVAFRLGIPYHVFNFKEDFERQVIGRFIHAYEVGTTPNPCIDCNRYLKFERLYQRAKELGYDTIVTGHYARIEQDAETGRWLLKKGVDAQKDQSYVLYQLTQEQLAHTCLPLGTYTKPEIREIAEKLELRNAHKAESQDICFVPDGDYAAFIRRHTGKEYPPGNFVNREGRILGQHKGLIHYTVGQRRGLGIAAPEPYYVCEKRYATNEIVLGTAAELLVSEFQVAELNWIAIENLTEPKTVMMRTRYHQKEFEATLFPCEDGRVKVVSTNPVQRPAPGQAAVFYEGDVVVGGGVIQ